MKAITFLFQYTSRDWKRLASVLKTSWEQHSAVPFFIITAKNPARVNNKKDSHVTNSHKINLWLEHFDDDTIFLDADMLCLADISEAFDRIDHLAYTERDYCCPLNGGVIFAKHTKKSKQLLQEWIDVNNAMYSDKDFHQTYRKKYFGINQAALGYLIEQGREFTRLDESYNLCEPWTDERVKTAKMLHVKTRLRDQVLSDSNLNKTFQSRRQREMWLKGYEKNAAAIKLWNYYDQQTIR